MRLFRKSPQVRAEVPMPSARLLYERGVLTYGGPCVCDIFDIGPRCGACVASCAANGHPLGTHGSGHPDFCFCGVPDGRDDPKPTYGGAA